MGTIDFAPLFRSTVGFDRLFDLLDGATRFEPSDNYPPYNIVGTFDIGAQWWGNAGTDDCVTATLNRLAETAHAAESSARTPTPSGVPDASANADVRTEVGNVNAA